MVNFLGVSRPDTEFMELEGVTPLFTGRDPNVELVVGRANEGWVYDLMELVDFSGEMEFEDLRGDKLGFMAVVDLRGGKPDFRDVEDFSGEIELKCLGGLGESIEEGGFMVVGLGGAGMELGARLGIDDFL